MRVLIAAYSCDPYRGSEAGVGWRAIQRLALRHEVFALVNQHNQDGWERAREAGIVPANVRVRFVAGDTACSRNRLIARIQSWFNYASYQRMVLEEALTWHREEDFDLCHQVTIASWRIPSPLWRMPLPFVWGPLGGAGRMPTKFRSSLGAASRVFEAFRDFNTWISSRRIAFRECAREATMVIAANAEAATFLKPHREGRSLVVLPIISFPKEVVQRFRSNPVAIPSDAPLRLFAGGNMIGTKGLAYALQALKLVADEGVPFHYTVAGGGPAISEARVLHSKLGLGDRVKFHQGYQGDDYVQALQNSDIYLLPSFREGTPVTMLEAMLAGCVPVVADISAPGEIARRCGGEAVSVESPTALVRGLAKAVLECAADRGALSKRGGVIADRVAEEFSSELYDRTMERVYAEAIQGAETEN